MKERWMISSYMTPTPHSIGAEQKLPVAIKLMREHRIRHLPVLEGGTLVGLVSDRDIRMIESLGRGILDTLTVDEAMSPEPYQVHPDTPLSEVARTMAEHKYGSAVVMQNGRVVGIFTVVDACRALAELFERRTQK